ncbi:MAG: AAA family ATPase [Calditrichaeota bacterium]|jgi:MoxR-like ATPase|nr:AAA family ATPase [Calditrichota bacterium]MBT7618534.1 AAA family ATPase [Calditrichota bacterium]MBT7789161.1 AAA family ATPase [Calditrichota bacterium]
MIDKTHIPDNDVEAVAELKIARDLIVAELGKAIIGQREIIDQLLISMLSRGHCLLVGVPGLAKTLMISTIAKILDLDFSRIQFTPDLMPSDITGTEIIEDDISTGKKAFRFIKGPIFGQIILADEINRTPPKTQAALLQAMQEHEVTTGGRTYKLEQPFFVLATQNPIEQEGTYPLPEAQLDRFMFSLYLDYPSQEEELEIVRSTTSEYVPDLSVVIDAQKIIQLQNLARRVPVSDHVVSYAVKLVGMTRPGNESSPDYISQWLTWGAGPRASQYLTIGAKTRAILDGRPTPEIEDIRFVARSVLRHRIVTSFNAAAEGITAVDVIDRLLEDVGEGK